MNEIPVVDIAQVISDPKLAIIPVLLFIGWILKNRMPVDNGLIPVVLTCFGVMFGVIFYHTSHGYAGSVLIGVAYAIAAVGLHSYAKNTLK